MASTRIHRDVRIPTATEGVTLSADLYFPAESMPTPALVTVVPYRKDMINGYEGSLQWFADHGYACVLVDHAGIGSSDGVPHAPWGEGETDDAVAAIDWAARQPWCDGSVGMWGMSHGGFTAMATAARQPAPLKAIIAIENALDIERDAMHPGGRGDLLRLAQWGTRMLAQQLLPPLHDDPEPEATSRWQRRLQDVEPHLLDLARLGHGHPDWRTRVIDVTLISVPTFLVGGWRDIYVDAVPRGFTRIQAPKRLLVGPWGHTLPHASPFGAIDFLPIALRWWDRWLRGVDDAVVPEPPAAIHVQGAEPGWRGYDAWPPPHETRIWRSGRSRKLTADPSTRRPATPPSPSTCPTLRRAS